MKVPVRHLRAILGVCLCSAPLSQAQVECWAPGMTQPVTLTSALGNGSKTVKLGKPYRYDVYGVAGSLELGGSARDATVNGGVFKRNGLLGIPGNTTVSSNAYVMMQTGLLNLKVYPKKLEVSGTAPGTRVGPVVSYGDNWTLSDPKNPAQVDLTFHQSGSSLLGGLLPGILEPSYANLNPKGTFYVLGEYHAAPPVMTGTLVLGADKVLTGCPVSYSYEIKKHDLPVYRPPLLGVLLSDINVTVLGTPPPRPAGNQSPNIAQVAVSIDPNQIQVAIDLNLTQGAGWKRTNVLP